MGVRVEEGLYTTSAVCTLVTYTVQLYGYGSMQQVLIDMAEFHPCLLCLSMQLHAIADCPVHWELAVFDGLVNKSAVTLSCFSALNRPKFQVLVTLKTRSYLLEPRQVPHDAMWVFGLSVYK